MREEQIRERVAIIRSATVEGADAKEALAIDAGLSLVETALVALVRAAGALEVLAQESVKRGS